MLTNEKNVTERVFRCPDCGTVVTAYKESSRRIVQGHTKHMYDYAENYEYLLEEIGKMKMKHGNIMIIVTLIGKRK